MPGLGHDGDCRCGAGPAPRGLRGRGPHGGGHRAGPCPSRWVPGRRAGGRRRSSGVAHRSDQCGAHLPAGNRQAHREGVRTARDPAHCSRVGRVGRFGLARKPPWTWGPCSPLGRRVGRGEAAESASPLILGHRDRSGAEWSELRCALHAKSYVLELETLQKKNDVS